MPTCFVDTNILLYVQDANDRRQKRAIDALDELRRAHTTLISTQVMQEFAHNALRKHRLPVPIVKAFLSELAWMRQIAIEPADLSTALDLVAAHQLSFWDAMLFAVAIRCECQVLLTEDLSHGQRIRGILIHNPLLPDSPVVPKLR